MKKRILAFALTLAMVVGSLSMLSFVTFAEEPATEIVSGAEAIAIGDVATVAADYYIVDKTVTFKVTAENLETLTLKVGGYVTTVTYAPSVAVDAASAKAGVKVAFAENVTTVTIPANLVSVYTNNEGNAVADVEIYVAEEEFKGTFVMKPVVSSADSLNPGLPITAYNIDTSPATTVQNNLPSGASYQATPGNLNVNFEEGTVWDYNLRFIVDNRGTHMSNSTMNRAISFTLKVDALKAYSFDSLDKVPVFSGVPTTHNVLQFNFSGGGTYKTEGDNKISNKDNKEIVICIINTIIDEKESLVLTYSSAQGRQYRIPLNVAPGEDATFDIMYTAFADNSGQITVNDKTVIRENWIWTNGNVRYSSSCFSSGIMWYIVKPKGDSSAIKATVSDISYVRSAGGVNLDAKNEDIINMFDKAVDKDGTIELSYVQETVPFVSTTAIKYSNSNAAGQGGTIANVANQTVFTVTDTKDITKTHRAYSQAGFAPLGEYGNRVITYKVNVASLAAYDFSNGGTLTGAAKYKDNINSKYAYLGDTGIGSDVSKSAFEKIYIGSIGKVNAYYDYYAASVFALVNDTTDGLVLVHTSSDGTETVIPVGKKFAQDITIKLTWNANDSGSIKVDTDEAVALTDCKTIYADLSAKGSAVQCYYSSYPSCYNGYIGLNLIRSTATYDENTTYSSATMTVEATVSNPLDVRFVATVDTLNAKEVGFEINLKGYESNVVKKSTDTVYSSINANVDGELNTITAADGKYFVALTVNGVPATGTVTLVVKPYLTYGGNTTYGTAYEVTYVDGVYAGCVAAN